MLRYLVTTFRTPQFQPSVIDDHYTFLDRLRKQGRLELAGPFTDRYGGAYILKAANLEEARALAHGDPLHISKLSIVTVYEWDAKCSETMSAQQMMGQNLIENFYGR